MISNEHKAVIDLLSKPGIRRLISKLKTVQPDTISSYIMNNKNDFYRIGEQLLLKPTRDNIRNKGTGAGGANTNKNGLSYEDRKCLDNRITIKKINKYSKTIQFDNEGKIFLRTKKADFFKCMEKEHRKSINKAHGCKQPDDCYIDKDSKIIYITEKKFQQGSGSTCEKIQTIKFKLWQYRRTFENYKIYYIYVLSDWFKYNCQAEIEYLDENNYKYFWGDSETFQDDIIKFIKKTK